MLSDGYTNVNSEARQKRLGRRPVAIDVGRRQGRQSGVAFGGVVAARRARRSWSHSRKFLTSRATQMLENLEKLPRLGIYVPRNAIAEPSGWAPSAVKSRLATSRLPGPSPPFPPRHVKGTGRFAAFFLQPSRTTLGATGPHCPTPPIDWHGSAEGIGRHFGPHWAPLRHPPYRLARLGRGGWAPL